MKKYLTRKNIGWVLTGLLSMLLLFSVSGKLLGSERITTLLSSHNLQNWITIIGIGELISLILFVIPKTMRLGALLLSAYFGGAIIFHITHSDPKQQAFGGPAMLLVFIWAIAWIRGLNLIGE